MEARIQSYTTAQLIGVSTSGSGGHYSDECIGVRFRYAAPHAYASNTSFQSGTNYGSWSILQRTLDKVLRM